MRIDCFEKIKHKEVKNLLQQAFNDLVTDDMPEQEQREIGKKIALDYYNEINKELSGLKQNINIPADLPTSLKNIIGKGISSDNYFTDAVKNIEPSKRGFIITDSKDRRINVIFDRGQLWTDPIQNENIKGFPSTSRPVYVQSSNGWQPIKSGIVANIEKIEEEAEEKIKKVDPKIPPSKLPVKSRVAQRKVRDDKIAAEIKAKLQSLKNLNKGGPTFTSGGIDPEKLARATELIGLYIKAGVYKFSDIIEDAYAELGEEIKALFDLLKQAYGGYYMTADQVESDLMDITEKKLTFSDITQDMVSEAKELEDFEKVEKSEPRRVFIDTVKEKIKNQEKQNIVSLRKLAADLGIDVVDTNLQEMAELAVVELSRDMANKSWQEKYILEGIIDIYDNQPTISMRSANRIELQQYSTPAPAAYLAGLYVAAGNPTSVFEPSAGNGIMTIAFKPEIVSVNEIDPVRLNNLANQGFKQVTDQDALNPFPKGKKYDGLVMNPPFGSSEQIEVNGYKISGLAQKMAINALQNLSNNGRAAIIIGGHNEYDDKGRITSERTFFNWLYNNYNVDAVINMSGELYAKQGTQFPTRLILINSRKAIPEGAAPIIKTSFKPFDFWTLPGHGDQLVLSNGKKVTITQVKGKSGNLYYAINGLPTTDNELIKFLNENKAINVDTESENKVITSFYEILKIVNDLKNVKHENIFQPGMDANRNDGDAIHGKGSEELQPDNEGGLLAIPGGKIRPNSGGRSSSKGNTGPNNGNVGGTDTGESDSNGISQDDNGIGPISDVEADVSLQQPDTGDNRGTGIGNIRGSQPVQSARKFESGQLSSNAKVPYVPKSKSQSVDTVIPSRMATDAENILTEIDNEYGGIDNFVQQKLGYKTKEELFNALSGEQVDAVAMTIVQIEKGQGMIIGDMTGVGKGRISAAILRYGINQGLKPIVLTETPGLFSDLYRDLVDIDPTENKSWSKNVKPFIVNDKNSSGDPTITDKDGNVVHKLMPAVTKKGIFQNKQIPKDANFVLATYSQFGTSSDKPSAKKDFFASISEGNILILDESHNVAGQSNRGEFFKEVIASSKGVLYLSATFAKTPQAMPVYAMKTAMQEANMSNVELVNAIEHGGVALQEVVAAQLVESGQMLRRERSFDGVNVDYEVLEEPGEAHREIADKITDIIRDIIDFQATHVAEVIQAMDDIAVATGSRMTERGGTNMAGVNNTPFASKVFNVIDQLLFSIKALDIADAAIEELKANRKPVIGFKSTMGSFLDHIGAQVGERLEKTDFSLTLRRALEGVMRYTEKDAQGNSMPGTISLADLSPEGREAYNRILDKIINASSGISISPIDVMIKRIQDAGYTVKEITGRNIMLEMQDDGSAVVVTRFEKDKKKIVREFNNGELDVVMLNMSGATGISMHASSKFKDQRQRVMIDGQLELDINKAVQKRGRIDRVGQVVRGAYRYIVSAIQAESRLLMMFKKKLKSLDANTTSSQKSIKTADVVDFLNKYGDEIVTEYLKENRELNDKLQDPLKFNDKSDEDLDGITKIENAALKVTGRVAILPTKEQNEFYKEVSERYTDYIEYLESNNSNDLEVKVLPLNAKVITSDIIVDGRGGDSPFGKPSILEQIETDVLKKPLKKSDIDKEISEGLEGKTPEQKSEEVLDGIETHYDGVVEDGIAKIEKQHQKNKITVAQNARDKAIENGSTDIEGDVAGALERLEFAKNESIKRLQTRNDFIKNNLSRLAQYFKIGNIYEVPVSVRTDTTIGTSKGVFLGFNIKKSRKNPYAPSAINMRFAVNDSRRVVSIPLSKQDFINAIIANSSFLTPQAKQNFLDNWDSLQSTRTREHRFMITGNLLQAYGTNDGQLVSYTDDQGNLLKGILLPENYRVQEQKRRIPISQAAQYLQARGSFVTTIDRDVTIKKESTGFTITVPLTRKAGGKYFLNKDLQQLVNERGFNQMAGKMTAYFSDSKLQDILDFLQREYNSSIEVNTKIKKSELLKEEKPEVDEELESKIAKDKIPYDANWTELEKDVWKNVLSKGKGLSLAFKMEMRDYKNLVDEGLIYFDHWGHGNTVRLTEKGEALAAKTNPNFQVAEPVSEEIQDLIDVIQEEVDNGVMSLKVLQDKVAKVLEDDSEKLRNQVAEAYNEYTKRFTPDEINEAINQRLSDNLSAMFGGTDKVIVLNDEDVLPTINRLGDVTFNATPEQQATQELLDAAIAEYQTAKKAFEAKRRELDKAIGADQADLFGERPKAQAPGLFDERVSQAGRDKAMEPFKARMVKAEKEVNRLQKKLDSLGNQTEQGALFNVSMPDGTTKQVKPVDVDVVNGFYSPLEKTINEFKGDRLPAKQWAEKFKGEEAKWTGLTDWLNSQTGSVSKADIQKFLKENRIEIVEVVKETGKADEKSKEEKLEDIRNAMRQYGPYGMTRDMSGDWFITYKGEEVVEEPELDALPQAVKDMAQDFYEVVEESTIKEEGDTKYSGYQLPGEKTNYKEVLITMPSKIPTYGEYQKRLGYPGHSALLEKQYLKEYGLDQLVDRGKNDFKSSHWDEPNILAHVRMNTRIGTFEIKKGDTFIDEKENLSVAKETITKTGKVLFLEEIQSDWGEIGRKQGFSTGEKVGNFTEYVKSLGLPWSDSEIDLAFRLKTSKEYKEWDRIQNIQHKTPQAPFVTDTNAWTKLAFKVALKEAVKQSTDGNAAWLSVTKPESGWDQLNNHFGSELASIIPLKVMDIPMLAALKNDKILRAVVEAIPVNVMDILTKNGISPELLLSQRNVLSNTLPSPSRSAIARGLADALHLVGTRLRTALNGVLSSDTGRGNEELLPAVSAKQLDSRIIVGLLAPSRIYGIDGNNAASSLNRTVTATKLPIARGDNIGIGGELSSTELAKLLNWHDLLLSSSSKGIVKYIPDNKIEKIAWTTGSQQAERYDLSKQVDNLMYRKNDDGSYYLSAKKDGGTVFSETNIPESKISDYVGKDVAEKIIKGEGEKGQAGGKIISGNNLKVGGKGMKAFYGVPSENKLGIVGNVAKSLFKQEPKTVQITTLPGLVEYNPSQSTSTQHSVDITPEMKAQVEAGQPLFMKSPDGKILGFKHDGKIYLNGKYLNPNTPIHEGGHIWVEWVEQNNKPVYKRGIELVSGSAYYDKVIRSKFYQSEALKLPADQRERYFKHEALSMAIGDKGAQFVTEAKRKGFTEWLKNLWDSIRKMLGFKNITAEELANLTFEEFTSRAAADILREQETIESSQEEQEEKEQQEWDSRDPIADFEMTTNGDVADMISGKTITSIFGEAPEGDQSYLKQKLFNMLQDGKDMIGAAMNMWGSSNLAVYGRPLLNYIKNMPSDKSVMAKKVVLMATLLGEIKEEVSRNPERFDELHPLENAVTAYYQDYMMQTAKSLSAGRILRLYRDKYMGDIFAHQILEEQEIKDQQALRKLQAEQMEIEARVKAGIEEFKQITQEEKDKADAEAAEKNNDAKIKQKNKRNMAPTDAQREAAAKAAKIKKNGRLDAIVDRIKNAINKCK